ncbi:MAG: DUF1579 domain-containing protein [Casimicrobium sp.]
MTQTNTRSSVNDFDFIIGRWRVSHRRLNARLANCTEWSEFGGTSEVRKLMGGFGNVDDNLLELPGGHYRAATLRSFDSATGNWQIWWLDGRYPANLDAPMVGRFANGLGEFYADDALNGTPIKVRFLWRTEDRECPIWEQAFSVDGGANWETNWVMRFQRMN